jgi:molybdate transport system ATP-binding protein
LRLKGARRLDGLVAYPWGDGEVLISGGSMQEEALYELSSTDIILFKRHPEAISARNLLKCRVGEVFEAGSRMGVELTCGHEKLVAVVVKESIRELEITEGAEIFAAMKATAFRQLG